jgi:alpha-tubulin suppressor-like RCC1 family protein
VFCWGWNDVGQRGDGSVTDAVEIAAGGQHTCARRASGTVVCWGRMLYPGTGGGREPIAVSGVTDAVRITSGDNHSCAIRSSGSVVCWGENSFGQVGNGTMSPIEPPTAVAEIRSAIEIDAGVGNNCALLSDGTVMCWGTAGTSGVMWVSPTPVPDLMDVVEISVGGPSTPFSSRRFARRALGDVVSWGLIPSQFEGL